MIYQSPLGPELPFILLLMEGALGNKRWIEMEQEG